MQLFIPSDAQLCDPAVPACREKTVSLPSQLSLKYASTLLLVAVFGISILQPRIAVSDSDAEAYLLGATSFHETNGYVDRLGAPLNHWPPGYSFLLSLAPNHKFASLAINYLAFGVATALLWRLAVYSGWTCVQALAVSLAFGFGFLRHLAVEAKPDILTYAIFLLGIRVYLYDKPVWRMIAHFFWASLIPVKFIAVVFTPGVLLGALCRQRARRFSAAQWKECVVAGCLWLLFLGGTILFNELTIHAWIEASHKGPSLASIVGEAARFSTGFLRTGLACWYGSIRSLDVLGPFAFVLTLGVFSLASLKPSLAGADLRWIGLSVLGLSWVLECVRQFYADPRLMGYGMLLILLGCVPRPSGTRVWLAYAIGSIGLATANSFSVVRFGVNHPQYEFVAKEVIGVVPRGEMLYTNAHRILDVHAGIPSQTVKNLEGLPSGAWYFEVVLPNYDAIAQPIGSPAARDSSWMMKTSFEGATLYRKEIGRFSGEWQK